MTQWKQFTVYPQNCLNRFYPVQTLYNFLPAFLADNRALLARWHFLFEPSLLVRIETDSWDAIWKSGVLIADGLSLSIEKGDLSKPCDELGGGEDYLTEESFYGDAVNENLTFLQACSELSLKLALMDNQVHMWRKHVHLMLNAFGLCRAQEIALGLEKLGGDHDLFYKLGRK